MAVPGEGELRYYVSADVGGYVGPMKQAKIHTERLDVTTRSLNITVKKMGRDIERAGKGALEASTRVRMLGGTLVSLSITAFVTGLMLRRMRHQTFAVEQAQKRLNKAIKEHGPASEEAREAQKRLALATEDLVWAQREQIFYFGLATMQMGVQLVRLKEIITAQKIQSLTALTSAGAHIKASIATAIHAVSMKKLAFAIGLATGGLTILLATLAWTAMQAQRTKEDMEDLHQTIGEAPSWGLVKSFEDLTRVARDVQRQINIGGLTVVVGREADLEDALRAYNIHVRREWRRLRR